MCGWNMFLFCRACLLCCGGSSRKMARYRNNLPQLSGEPFLTDGGIETTLIYLEGMELPYFAAFHMLQDDKGRAALQRYYRRYASIAADHKVGFILESSTWRASRDWGAKLGYDSKSLASANRRAIEILVDIRREYESGRSPMVISGCVGPRGGGYSPSSMMTAQGPSGTTLSRSRLLPTPRRTWSLPSP